MLSPCRLLEVAVDYVDQLLGSAILVIGGFGVDEVSSDVVFKYHGEQPIHRAPATRDLLEDVHAATLVFERALDGFDLSFDTAYSVEQLLFFPNGMAHGCASIG
jgi:hypothetical protein